MNSTVMQYAGDTTMAVVVKDAVTLEDRNDLKLKKTNLMLIGRNRREKELNEVKIVMRDQLLERSRTVKCHGRRPNVHGMTVYSHFVNSHFVNSHFVNSHLVNFPLRQFPLCQFPFRQC